MEIRKHHVHSSKDHLVEAAVASLRRLNSTITEMKRWTLERKELQNDIWHLQTSLETIKKDATSVLLFRDPLVKHQNEEIRRLETTNDNMKSKLERLNNLVLETEQVIAWNVDKKVRNEIVKVNNQVAEERLQFVREIAQLKKQLEETESNTTLIQIKAKLEKFIEGDRKIDNFLHQITSKVIGTVSDLSSKHLTVNEILRRTESEKCHFQAESLRLKYLMANRNASETKLQQPSCFKKLKNRQVNLQVLKNKLQDEKFIYHDEEKLQVKKLQAEKEMLLKEKITKEKALRRNVSGVKTKLTIALMRNDKLSKKIRSLEHEIETKLSSVKTDSSIQTESEAHSLLELTKKQLTITTEKLSHLEEKLANNSEQQQFQSELTTLKSCNENLTNQLLMENQAVQEVLKKFELCNLEYMTLKKEITKLKLQNRELKEAKVIKKKKDAALVEEKTKDIERLQNQNQFMNTKINKLTGDLKKIENKNQQYEKTIQEFKVENKKLVAEIENLTKNYEEILQNFNQEKINNLNYEEIIKNLKYENENLIKQKDTLNNDLENIKDEIENLKDDIDNEKTENFHINELLCNANELNEDLDNNCKKYIIDIQILTQQLIDTENECTQLKNNLENKSLMMINLENLNTTMKQSIEISTAENEKLTTDLVSIANKNTLLECQLQIFQNEKENLTIDVKHELKEPMQQLELSSTTNVYSRDLITDKLLRPTIGDYNKNIAEQLNKETINKMFNNSEKTLLKSLQETERELMGVKCELTEVKKEIGYLRSDLDSGKFGLRNIENENYALKEELAKLRNEKKRLLATLRDIETGIIPIC